MTKSLFIQLNNERHSSAWQTASKFVIGGTLWIVVSDLIVFFSQQLDRPHFPLFHIEVMKGIVFVLVMGAFIYYLVRKNEAERTETDLPFLFVDNPTPMWIFDIESFKILEVNRAAIQCYGYSRVEFLSMTLCELRPKSEMESLNKAAAHIDGGLFFKGPSVHIKKDGTRITTEISALPIEFQHRRAAVITSIDISERVRLQSQLSDLKEIHERELHDKVHEVALYNRELQLRLREIDATNEELLSINKMLMDVNTKFQQRVESEQRIRAEQIQRCLERSESACWSWHVQDPELRYVNTKARALFGLSECEEMDAHDFWKSKIDSFDRPLVEIHLAILEKDDFVEFTYKLEASDVLVRQRINIIRNEEDLPMIIEYEAYRVR